MESGSVHSSPVLRVTTEISEVKDGKEFHRHSCSKPHSRESRTSLQGNSFTRKKTLHPIQSCNPYQVRASNGGSCISIQNAKSNVSTFTQRIMSAKLLRVKQLQNQLAESQSRIAELINENKLLKTLQRRQDSALQKYEGSQEQLPQLIRSHNEEIRVINSKFKQLKLNYRILENKLKERDNELINLKEQHRHLLKLSRDRQLGDREKLTKKLSEMESHVKAQQEKIQMLTRKIELEGKNYRHRLNLEVNKHKETQIELRDARRTIDNLKSSIEGKQRLVNTATLQKKIVRSSTREIQLARSSLPPPPPGVSIRQPQRMVKSEAALNRDEDTDSDSFSFGLQHTPPNIEDSCSDRSDSNQDEKPIFRKRFNDKTRKIVPGTTNLSNNHNYMNGAAGNVSSAHSLNSLPQSSSSLVGIKSTVPTSIKSGSTESRLTFIKSNSTTTIDNKGESLKILKKGSADNLKSLMNSTNNTRRNSLSTVSNISHNSKIETQEKKLVLKRNSFKMSVSMESVKSEVSNKNNGSSATPDDVVTGNYSNQLQTIQAGVGNELGASLGCSKGDNSALLLSNETFSHSMEAAIEELERKFKIFDMPQIRKETEDDINKIVDRACRSLLEQGNDSIEAGNEIKSNHVPVVSDNIGRDDILFEQDSSVKEVEDTKPELVLAESKKADLLKALNNIDSESNLNEEITSFLHERNDNFSSKSLKKLPVHSSVGLI